MFGLKASLNCIQRTKTFLVFVIFELMAGIKVTFGVLFEVYFHIYSCFDHTAYKLLYLKLLR